MNNTHRVIQSAVACLPKLWRRQKGSYLLSIYEDPSASVAIAPFAQDDKRGRK